MALDIQKEVLFVGLGSSAVCYYRVMLPAMTLGCDWTGIAGDPPDIHWTTGLVRGESKLPEFDQYKVVVLQQMHSPGWFDLIQELQRKGVKVLFEVDDYLHGIAKVASHDFRKNFDKKLLAKVEAAMRMCDGVIASTEFIAKRYRKFNRNTFVCENGLDLKRYALTRPKRDTVNIGWSGATGHRDAIVPWLHQVLGVMDARPNTTFVSVGQPFANAFIPHVGEGRAIAVPFAQVEQYPAAMTMMDIALAPAGRGSFFRGKSDLRWLEAGALGVPLIADPMVYPKIEHGVTGFHAESPMEAAELTMRLVDNEELRTRVGESAREYVERDRSMQRAADQWVRVFEALVD